MFYAVTETYLGTRLTSRSFATTDEAIDFGVSMFKLYGVTRVSIYEELFDDLCGESTNRLYIFKRANVDD